MLLRQFRIMMLYRPLVIILTIILYIYKEETHIVSTKNLINQITYNSSQCKQTRGLLNINFAKELELDKYLMLFYHLKHSRWCPLSIPVDLKQKHHRIIIIMIISGDISVNQSLSNINVGDAKDQSKKHTEPYNAMFVTTGGT